MGRRIEDIEWRFKSATFRAARTKRLDFERPVLMGILNVTPDSFSDGARYATPAGALRRARAMIDEGAHIIDVGAASSRPDSKPPSTDVEIKRAIPVIERIRDRFPSTIISVDTCNVDVATRALDAGADMINDIMGLADPKMIELIARHDLPVVLNHIKGTPATMNSVARYRDLRGEIDAYFRARIKTARSIGATKLIIDPGIGFAKLTAHSIEAMRSIPFFRRLGRPILIGASRKRFLGEILAEPDPTKREEGTMAISALASYFGASIIRVHEVGANLKSAIVGASIRR